MSPSRRDILRAAGAAALAMAARVSPAAAAEAATLDGRAGRIVAPFLREGRVPALGLWSGHLQGGPIAPQAEIALPARVHAVALDPAMRRCVAVARRPGRFGLAVDLTRFERSQEFASTPGRSFFGHGLFAADGSLFFTTENDDEAGRGIIGVRDAGKNFRAIGEWASGGVGPHDIALDAGGRRLLVANGGIDFSPESGRAKLNEDGIASSIAVIDIASGRQDAAIALGEDMASLSIRHLAMLGSAVAFGCQETLRDGEIRPLAGIAALDGKIRWLDAPPGGWAAMAGYVGGIAADETGRLIAATSPLGSLCAVWDAASGRCLTALSLADCCAIAAQQNGFVVAGGHGGMASLDAGATRLIAAAAVGFDNHLAVV